MANGVRPNIEIRVRVIEVFSRQSESADRSRGQIISVEEDVLPQVGERIVVGVYEPGSEIGPCRCTYKCATASRRQQESCLSSREMDKNHRPKS